MKIVLRSFYFIIALGLLFLAVKLFGQLKLVLAPIDQILLSKVQNSTQSVVYVASKDKWLEFPLPKHKNYVRVLSTANVLKTDILNNPELLYSTQPIYENFAIRLQIVDDADEILMDKIYKGRTSITVYKSDDLARPEISALTYYLKEPFFPTNSVNTLIDLTPYAGYSKLKIKLESHDPMVKEVVERVYINRIIPKYQLDYLWQRLDEFQKRTLTKGSVYPADLMNNQERSNILANQWHAIGPYGIPGYGYVSRKLYSYNEPPGSFVKPPLKPYGYLVDKNHVAMIPAPEDGGNVQLDFNLLQKDVNEAKVKVLWRGRGIKQRRVEEVKITRQKPHFTGNFGPGFFEISSKEKFTVRIFQNKNKKLVEVTPPPIYLRVFPLDHVSPLEFEIETSPEGIIPFRVDFRCLMSEKDINGKLNSVRYELLDGSNKVVSKGVISETFPFSRYDWLDLNNELFTISDYVSKFFYLPKNIKRIRFIKDSDNIFISAYNRTPDLIQEVKVPEDTYYSIVAGEKVEKWFYIRPINYDKFVKENNFVQLLIEYRPPEEDPNVVEGIYNWNDFFPKGKYYARRILIPVDYPPVYRAEGLESYFRKIPSNQDVKLDFKEYKAQNFQTPDLVWIRKDEGRADINTMMDGKLNLTTTIQGTNGSIRLAPINPGIHTINIKAPEQIDFYINYTWFEKDGLLSRTAHKIDHSSLNFTYQKATREKEEMILYFFPNFANPERSKLRVTITSSKPRKIGIMNDWSPLVYLFDINNLDQNKARVLGVSDEYVGTGQPLFIPMGADLPIGDYQVKVEHIEGAGGYLSMTSIIPGMNDNRKFHIQVGK